MRALLSVSDKTGIVEFARGLEALGCELVSTGGTAAHLAAAGLAVRDVASVTGFPEMLGGRVKTLHPKIFAGILARREAGEDMAAIAGQDIGPFDIVAVNLYPFSATIARENTAFAEAVEQIDIGGPSLLRAAAKNHASVYAVVDAADYPRVLAALGAGEADQAGLRRELAARVFRHTAAYDAVIANWFTAGGTPETLVISGERAQDLRYGENPHQRAAFYRDPVPSARATVADCEQLHGKELSYNNLLDLSAALEICREFAGETDHFCCILKHNNPCGAALRPAQEDALAAAWEGDSEAAYGSVIGFTKPLDAAAAAVLGGRFVEIVAAPDFSPEALELLRQKKNVRLMRFRKPLVAGEGGWIARRVSGGWLWQEEDAPGSGRADWTCGSARQPDAATLDDLEFVWKIVKHVRSNAIVVGQGRKLFGCGAGQMSRIDSVRLALGKAGAFDGTLVLASDAYFPFRDNIDLAAAGRVSAIIQPGGSIRDDEVRQACDEHGLVQMLSGKRHFLH